MPSTGRRDLVANRWEPFVHVIRWEGFDFTGATFVAEVRDRKDGGFQRASLETVGSIGTEGITLVSVETVDGMPVSTTSMRINEPNVEAMNVATEAGEDGVIWWDMQITAPLVNGGVKYRALEGAFTVKAGVSGSGA